MLKRLKGAYHAARDREEFRPGMLGLFVHPFFFARRGLYESISAFADQIHGSTLDVGCGIKPYAHLFRASNYVGLEIDSPEGQTRTKADYFYDGHEFPFPDDHFDSVVASQVFEHVFNPDDFLDEVNRVLRGGGKLLLTTPFVWDEHLQPYDYARYSSFGLKHVLEKHGFHVVRSVKSINDVRVVFQLLNDYTYKKTLSSNPYVNLLVTVGLMAPVNILGELLSKFLPRNDDLYLDNIVLAVKQAAAEHSSRDVSVLGSS